MSQIVTPAVVESRLVQLSKELDAAHTDNVQAEESYFTAKADYEIGVAAARLAIGGKHAEMGIKVTVQEREDEATMKTSELLKRLYQSEALVKAARANVQRVRTQVDLTRSIAANVRSSLEM